MLAFEIFMETQEADNDQFIRLLAQRLQQQEPALYECLLMSAQQSGRTMNRVVRETLSIGLYNISKEAAAFWFNSRKESGTP